MAMKKIVELDSTDLQDKAWRITKENVIKVMIEEHEK